MRLLVSSAKGANGAGYGAILAFDFVGSPLGTFCDDSRVATHEDCASIQVVTWCMATTVTIVCSPLTRRDKS